MEWIVNGVYLVVAVLFVVGLKAMSSPVKARRGIAWAGVGMVLATLATFAVPGMGNLVLIMIAIVLGGGAAWWAGRVVKMTDMPQMVAVYNGMGGGAAALIAAVEFARAEVHGPIVATLAVLGSLIGSVAFSGSVVAFLKLQGVLTKALRLPAQNLINVGLAALTLGLGAWIVTDSAAAGTASPWLLVLFFLLSLALGAVLTMPIGGADMPVVISLLNAFTGLAVGFEGYVLGNPTLIIAGIVVGASGMLLTQLMAKAMNRPILNVLFTPITGEAQAGTAIEGRMKEVTATDVAALMRFAEKVIIVPGYGMAVAGAQHKVWEMAKLLEDAGVEVSFASLLGVDYVVERTESLVPSGWEPWMPVTGTGETIVLPDTLEPGGRYYRVGMQSVDMGITQNAMPNPVMVGQELTYMLEVRNLGGPPARQVQVFDPLPAGVEFISAEVLPAGTCVFADGMLICDLGTVLPGPVVSVVIRVRPQEPGLLENTAIVANPAPDPVAGNDSSTVATTVLPP